MYMKKILGKSPWLLKSQNEFTSIEKFEKICNLSENGEHDVSVLLGNRTVLCRSTDSTLIPSI